MSDPLPSSQVFEDPNAQRIFLKPDGTNWHIFVEAGGITGGFRLRRLLKKAGAVICSDPKQSQVILVDSSTTEGRLFIRDWGNDENKVVLEHSWANRCISEGRVLDESHQWGGFLTQDDGLPITKEEIDDIPKSPLPTPRETPEERVAVSRGHVEQGEQSLVSTSEIKAPQPTTARSQSPVVPMQPLNPVIPISHQSLEPQQPSTHIPPSQYLLPQSVVQQPPLHTQDYSTTLRTLVDFLSQQSDPRIGAQYVPMLAATAASWPWIPPSEQNMHTITMQMMNSQEHPADTPLFNMYAHTSDSAQMTDSQYQDVPLPIPSPTLPPSTHRRSPAVSLSSSEARASRSKKRSRGRSSGHLPSAEASSSAQHISASRQPSSQNGTLFTSEAGKGLSFFVQVDLKDRQPTINTIKKNGGVLSSDHVSADYSVLFSRSSTFKDLRWSTHAAGRPAVNASFVHDCVAQNMVLDPTPYLFPLPTSGKRKRPEGSDQSIKSRKKTSQGVREKIKEEESTPLPTIKPKKEDKSPLLRPISLDDDRTRPRSPTPPSDLIHVQTTSGVRYSEQEREYALRYVEVLLERDHHMSMNAMAGSLFKKLPSHSLASWRSFLLRTVRDDVESTRKRKSIAYRKAQRAEGDSKRIKIEQSPDRSLDTELPTSGSLPTPISDRESIRKEDLEAISQFFATRPEEDGEDDADVWALLTSQATCQTASSWEEFYTAHHEEVNARFTELTNNPMS